MNELVNQQNVLADFDALDKITRFAELMATGRCTVPVEYQGNPGDCLALSLQAQAWGMNPFTVAQKSFVIKGKLGYEAQLVNAVITRHAPITGRPVFRYSDGWERILGQFRVVQGQKGPYNAPDWQPEDEVGLWCEVSATMIGEDEPRVLRMLLVQAQPRQSTQWATDPKQQLSYAAMKKWARLHCPDVILGIYTPEELQQRETPTPAEKDITPLKAALAQQGESLTARKENDPPPAKQAAPQTDGEELASTETTPKNTNTEHTGTVDTQSRAERIRDKLREQNQIPIAEPNEEDHKNLKLALDCIQNTNSVEQLEQCGKDLRKLDAKLHPFLAGEARQAFQVRMNELKG